MIALAIVVIAIIIYWLVDKKRRDYRKTVQKRRIHIKETDTRISYKDLASRRHTLRTARNMIKLGLVKQTKDPIEAHLYLIYDTGVPPLSSPTTHQIAARYGLIPDQANFVGH